PPAWGRPIVCQSCAVDLKHWIASDHMAVATRFDNAIGQHVPQQLWREAGPGGGPSIAWFLFHMTYYQDLALKPSIRDQEPLLDAHREAIGLGDLSPGQGLSEAEDPVVTDALVLEQLDAYVADVNTATAAWIDDLSVMALDSAADTSWRLEHKAGIP